MKKGDGSANIIKDTCIALLTTAGLILTITFGLISAVVSPSVLLQIRWPIVASCLCLTISIIAGVYLIRYLISSAEAENDHENNKSPQCGNPEDGKRNLNRARTCSRVQFFFFVLGVVALIVSVGIRLFNLN